MAKPTQKSSPVKKISLVSKKVFADRISENIGKKHSLTKSQIEIVLTEYLEQTKQALVNGEEIRLPGFFSLKTVVSKPRIAMNLQTKKKMTIPAKRVPKIKFSVDLKEQVAKKK